MQNNNEFWEKSSSGESNFMTANSDKMALEMNYLLGDEGTYGIDSLYLPNPLVHDLPGFASSSKTQAQDYFQNFRDDHTTVSTTLDEEKSGVPFSKHVTSVISHFTSSKDGYARLLNEIDDFVHVVNSSAFIYFASPSSMHLLGYSQDEVIDLAHKSDVATLRTYLGQRSEFLCYVRYVGKTGLVKLVEVRGTPYSPPELLVLPSVNTAGGIGESQMFILAAREYASKASQSLDSIVELQVETLQLQHQLETVLRSQGKDISGHPLLSIAANEPEDDYTESFLFTIQQDNTQHRPSFQGHNFSPDDIYSHFAANAMDKSTAPLVLPTSSTTASSSSASEKKDNIWVAASDGKIEAVKEHLANGVSIDAKDENGYSVLMAACSWSHLDLVRLLVEMGADLATFDEDGDTLLHTVSDLAMAQALVGFGVAVAARNQQGLLPVETQYIEGNDDIVAYLDGLEQCPGDWTRYEDERLDNQDGSQAYEQLAHLLSENDQQKLQDILDGNNSLETIEE
ncbi:hypothetical protein HDV03_004126 [Kappamyces sp. JEL0829]|nr:hypothetical protein HDV03_004126 [Kappamyces sp. JEL0829]